MQTADPANENFPGEQIVQSLDTLLPVLGFAYPALQLVQNPLPGFTEYVPG